MLQWSVMHKSEIVCSVEAYAFERKRTKINLLIDFYHVLKLGKDGIYLFRFFKSATPMRDPQRAVTEIKH